RVGRPRVEEDGAAAFEPRLEVDAAAGGAARDVVDRRRRRSRLEQGPDGGEHGRLAARRLADERAHGPRRQLELACRPVALDGDPRNHRSRRRRRLGRPQRAEVRGGIARLPAAEEALDGRMQCDAVEVGGVEQPVPAYRGVLRGHGLERPSGEVGREDDVHDVLRAEPALGRDRVDDRDRPLDWQLVGDADLLEQLAMERGDEALARIDAAAGQEPILAAAGLLVAAQQDAVLPAQNRRDTDARLLHQAAEEPKPRTPRSLSGSSSTSIGSTVATGTTTSCAMRMPGSTTNDSRASVLSRTMRNSPRYPESTSPGVFTIVIPWRDASPERGWTKPA